MAKYLRTSSITAELENLIRDAKEKVYIISPYLKLSDHIRQLLNDKEREKVEVRIIFGKQELAPTEMEYLESLSYVRLYFFKNLHAKCYLNESKMIIASMNLYEFSQQHNREMGILIDTVVEHDREAYEDAIKDVDSILHNSEDFSYVKAPKRQPNKEAEKIKPKETSNNFSNSKYLTTKELSKKTGLSSRKVNSVLVKNELMYKKEDDWYSTEKGNKLGAIQKEGAYGKFIIWPEEIADNILK
ncbi:PLD-like domain-containing protein [Salegentibacter echinorum]|uniref:PLD-like domain-containing protein n=1 Tax=Salegentibacter echinorum TaxID=1073325 RepID=A0A1M5LTL2_SALEC|nr:phospholipase D family protein [Salegentibacter echinorum]SHG68417.1 PLD-like domain-containing protein [Salegentibacter echinorum]